MFEVFSSFFTNCDFNLCAHIGHQNCNMGEISCVCPSVKLIKLLLECFKLIFFCQWQNNLFRDDYAPLNKGGLTTVNTSCDEETIKSNLNLAGKGL